MIHKTRKGVKNVRRTLSRQPNISDKNTTCEVESNGILVIQYLKTENCGNFKDRNKEIGRLFRVDDGNRFFHSQKGVAAMLCFSRRKGFRVLPWMGWDGMGRSRCLTPPTETRWCCLPCVLEVLDEASRQARVRTLLSRALSLFQGLPSKQIPTPRERQTLTVTEQNR